MAIRETFRRALRRSDDSNGSQTSPSTSTATPAVPSSSSSSSLHKTPSRLTNWSWSSASKDKEPTPKERKPKDKAKKRVVHPSQRPLTTQNLAHQEMLSHFTMAFGASNSEQIETGSFVGISPCCTRTPSLAGDYSSGSSDGSATPRSCSSD